MRKRVRGDKNDAMKMKDRALADFSRNYSAEGNGRMHKSQMGRSCWHLCILHKLHIRVPRKMTLIFLLALTWYDHSRLWWLHAYLSTHRAPRRMTLSFRLAWRSQRLWPSLVSSLAFDFPTDIEYFVNQTHFHPISFIYQRIYSISLSTLIFSNKFM